VLGPSGSHAGRLELARGLLEDVGDLSGLVGIRPEALRHRGLSEAKTASVLAALELARRLARSRVPERKPLDAPAAAASYLTLRYAVPNQEVFGALFLDSRSRLIGEGEIFRGALSRLTVEPAQILRSALLIGAAGIVAFHTHPSGARFGLRALALLAITFCVAMPTAAQGHCRLVQITDSPWNFRDSLHPAISGDGRTVTFASEADLLGNGADFWSDIFTWQRGRGTSQITNNSGWVSWAPVLDRRGSSIAYMSVQDPLGTNGDHSFEIFLWNAVTGLVQITDSPGFTSLSPAINGNGRRVAFSSTADFFNTGDLPFQEIFLWDATSGLTQITRSASRFSQRPSISSAGDRIVFESTANPLGTNTDGRFEVFLWREGRELLQLSSDPIEWSRAPAISADGHRVAFESSADLVGQNADGTREIFLWDDRTGLLQITDSSTGVSLQPTINANGSRVAFTSSADLVGTNPNGRGQIFLWDERTGLGQVTTTQLNAALTPSIDASGRRIAFVSTDDLLGANPDGSLEVFLAICPGSPCSSNGRRWAANCRDR